MRIGADFAGFPEIFPAPDTSGVGPDPRLLVTVLPNYVSGYISIANRPDPAVSDDESRLAPCTNYSALDWADVAAGPGMSVPQSDLNAAGSPGNRRGGVGVGARSDQADSRDLAACDW